MPLLWSSPWGRVTTQFKNFVYSNARFVNNYVLRPIRQNPNSLASYKPLLTWLATTQVTGTAAIAARSLIMENILGVKRGDRGASEKVIENVMALSPYVFAYEVFQGLSYGKGLESIFGPTASDVEQIGEKLIKGKVPYKEIVPNPFGELLQQQLK